MQYHPGRLLATLVAYWLVSNTLDNVSDSMIKSAEVVLNTEAIYYNHMHTVSRLVKQLHAHADTLAELSVNNRTNKPNTLAQRDHS